MPKHQHIVAIDPDTNKNGVTYLHTLTRQLTLKSLTFPLLLDYLQTIKATAGNDAVVIVEAGYLNKSNWHVRSKDNNRVASAKGNHTGRNHEVARKIIEMCKHYGLEVIEQRPLRKMWKGEGGKITHEELAYFAPISGRTNPEERDSCLLAWNYAGFPIKVKKIKIKVMFYNNNT